MLAEAPRISRVVPDVGVDTHIDVRVICPPAGVLDDLRGIVNGAGEYSAAYGGVDSQAGDRKPFQKFHRHDW